MQVQSHASPQAIFTSFKLEKNGIGATAVGIAAADASSEPTEMAKLSDAESPRQRHCYPLNRSDASDSPAECRGETWTSERKRKLSFSSTQSNENDKVSVVRAAGTFFPQNCNDEPTLMLKKDEPKSGDTGKSKCPVESTSNYVCNEVREPIEAERLNWCR